MATAKDVKIILQQTVDGVENVKLVNDSVKAVDDRVKTIADGGQRLSGASSGESSKSSLNLLIQTARQPPRSSFNKRPTE